MHLIPINEHIEDNKEFIENPLCKESVHMTIDFYKKVGYEPPWIGYYAKQDEVVVGAAGFKGPPLNDTVEIAYGVFEAYQHKGIGAEICRLLVQVALKAGANITITARTLLPDDYSSKILKKNGFDCAGIVNDPEDGDVCEWVYSRR